MEKIYLQTRKENKKLFILINGKEEGFVIEWVNKTIKVDTYNIFYQDARKPYLEVIARLLKDNIEDNKICPSRWADVAEHYFRNLWI